ncbi:DUF3037 domain-containing protein [Sediminibacterium roseum]|uniref:DUF3037 domain-containing protein n=1 Tax=Sediminibacterium roseum TaxID=1978412 RepID=A0ABW9ZS08_9BACT|nr:DUF3037 domain-containing protein [Sediminibacterium roseum]NCI49305.1 DUF3037 domain-containing protein [Sediminibacterium roseum]
MPGTQLFEYAVIRIVPRVEREEFLNVGVVLYCKDAAFLRVKYFVEENKLKALCGATEIAQLKQYLAAFEAICNGNSNAGPIARLDAPSRFRWLTATRSTVVQTSRVHPGLCKDPSETLQRLYEQLVL